MPRFLKSPLTGLIPDGVIPVDHGGSGGKTVAEAQTNLGLIATGVLGQTNGLAQLSTSSKVPVGQMPGIVGETVMLDGPATIYATESYNYTITNYSALTVYTVSSTNGVVNRSGNTITYTPGIAGNGNITVNGHTYPVTVLPVGVNMPTITSPVNDALNRPWKQTFTTSAFAFTGVTDTHASTDWSLATDSGFNNIVRATTADTVNKTTWTVTDLDPGITYYVRVRHTGTDYGSSEWSATVSFTTRSTFLPTTEDAILTASDKAASDAFGISIALTPDASRLAVGAKGADVGGVTDCGAVYVYTRSGTTWTLEQKLTASDKAASDQFGYYRISFTPDGSRLVIPAPYADISGVTDAGAVYVFSRSGSTWTQEAKLTASDRAANDWFGLYAASITADASRIVVGARNATRSGITSCGAVYVFTRSGTTWTQEAGITANDKVANDTFGYSAEIDSTGTRFITGAMGADIGGLTDAGAAYVYIRSGTTWTLEQKLTADDKAANEAFGHSVLLTADGDRAIVSAWNANVGSIVDSGAVYVFTRTGTTWAQEAKLVPLDVVTLDHFGIPAINSTASILVVGDYYVAAGSDVGAVYVFTRSGTTWTQQAKITASDKATNVNNAFRFPAISENGELLAVGAFGRDSDGITDSGAVYFYTPSGYLMAEEAILTAGDKAANDGFGASVVITGDGSRIAIGSIYATVGGITNCGAVYVYTRSGNSWVLEQKLTASDKAAGDALGLGIDITTAGDRLVVAAAHADVSALSDTGAVYVFTRTGTTWTQEAKLTASDKAAGDMLGHYGTRITSDGSRVISGAVFADVGGIGNSGALYVFSRSGTTWTQEAKISPADRATNDRFGFFADITDTGDRVAVGAQGCTVGGITSCGAVYVFSRSGTTWTQEAKLSASDKTANASFGIGTAISATGDRLITSAYVADVGGITDAGAVYVFSRSGTTWTQEAILLANDAIWDGINGFRLGERIAITPDASIAVLNSFFANAKSSANVGAVYVFTRSGTTWTFQTKYSANTPSVTAGFGSGLSITADGTELVIGSSGADPSGVTDAGVTYIFS